MTMVITVVPPVGPPIPVIAGRAIQTSPDQDYEVYLDDIFEKDGVYFEVEDSSMVFPNGTIIYK